VRLVPFIRSTAFGFSPACGGVETLEGRFKASFPGFFGERRVILRDLFLRYNRKWIDASRRSLSRGLGLPVRYDEVVRSGLWDRELWYLSLPRESALPIKPSKLDQVRIPVGYELRRVHKVTKRMREASSGVAAAFVAAAWSDASLVRRDEGWRDSVGLPPDWITCRESRPSAVAQAALLGISVRNCHRFLRIPPKIFFDYLSNSPLKRCWLPVGFSDSGMPPIWSSDRDGVPCGVGFENPVN